MATDPQTNTHTNLQNHKHTHTHRQDRLQYTAPQLSAQYNQLERCIDDERQFETAMCIRQQDNHQNEFSGEIGHFCSTKLDVKNYSRPTVEYPKGTPSESTIFIAMPLVCSKPFPLNCAQSFWPWLQSPPALETSRLFFTTGEFTTHTFMSLPHCDLTVHWRYYRKK